MKNTYLVKLKDIFALIDNEASFFDGINKLLQLRNEIFKSITTVVNNYPIEALSLMPFYDSSGYKSKTIAYSIYHIFRIEDIVCSQLIHKQQIFFKNNYQQKMNSTIITTGNELVGQQIVEFSQALNYTQLLNYASEVKSQSDNFLSSICYRDLKMRFCAQDKQSLLASGSVSKDEKAIWLVDYWCKKNLKGLILMPFSHHWISHYIALCEIKNKLCHDELMLQPAIACCGLSCRSCFLKQYCGGCRSSYNVCSYAMEAQDKKCANVVCTQERNLKGCWQCADFKGCKKGFYHDGCQGGQAAKANCMFINEFGEKELIKVYKKLHKRYDFEKCQEILGDQCEKGFQILKENR